jgi:hypothetical protein
MAAVDKDLRPDPTASQGGDGVGDRVRPFLKGFPMTRHFCGLSWDHMVAKGREQSAAPNKMGFGSARLPDRGFREVCNALSRRFGYSGVAVVHASLMTLIYAKEAVSDQRTNFLV